MAIIDLPQPDVNTEARPSEAVPAETVLQHETEHALGQAVLFLDNVHLGETNIVSADDYGSRPKEWDMVISSVYNRFMITPPTSESRTWTPLGPEAEYGWLSNIVKHRVGLTPEGKYVAFRLFDTVVERPDGAQTRTLYANRLGMPTLPNSTPRRA